MKKNILGFLRKNKSLHNSYLSVRKIFYGKIAGDNNSIENNAVSMFQSCYNIKGNNNKIVLKDGVILNKVDFVIIGDNNTIFVDKGSALKKAKIYMSGNDHTLHIGEKCHYADQIIWFEDSSGKIEIGDKSTFESTHIAVTEGKKITIGKNCMFSSDIEVRVGDSHSIYDNETGQRINPASDIIIGDHVWIGAKATILKGVNIGKNSIVSTGAIVTKDVPGNVIVSGIPARIIRENVSWDRERT